MAMSINPVPEPEMVIAGRWTAVFLQGETKSLDARWWRILNF
jgi:hypothetical protein